MAFYLIIVLPFLVASQLLKHAVMLTLWNDVVKWVQETWHSNPTVFGGAIGVILTFLLKDLIVTYVFAGIGKVLKWSCDFILRGFAGLALVDRFVFLNRYRCELEERVSVIKNIWLPSSKRLSDIFVPISATASGVGSERIELRSLFFRHRTIVIVGDPGSGKTTGLKAIALDCIKGRLLAPGGRSLVPVFVELRQLAKSGHKIDSFIADQLDAMRFPKAERSLTRLEKQSRLVYLLDGLDEVDDEKRTDLFDQLQSLLDRQTRNNPGCHIIITSRPIGYDGQLAGHVIETARMAEFTPADIRRFLAQWPYDEEENKSADDLALQITTRPPILKICSNPLMLTIVAWLYSRPDFVIPDSREEFYAQCVEALLRAWDKTKNLERNRIAPELKDAFLRAFAYESLLERQLDFTDGWVLEKVEAYLAASTKYKELDAVVFKNELYRSGIIGRLPNGEAFFAHKTLAEFLAARYLRSRFQFLVDRWREAPTEWLEVCSLYVADPDTATERVQQLILMAYDCRDWNSALILAGEAANCPIEVKANLLKGIADEPALWSTLEQRALNALARFRVPAHSILEKMLAGVDRGLAARVLHTLSVMNTPWASGHLTQALIYGAVDNAAVEALTLMGENGVPIVDRVLNDHLMISKFGANKERLYRACGKVLENIGSLEATHALAEALLRGRPEETTQSQAQPLNRRNGFCPDHLPLAFALGRMLDQASLRISFEASGPSAEVASLLPLVNDQVKTLLAWALPWMPNEKVYQRTVYAITINLIAREVEKNPQSGVPLLDLLWIRLVFPVLITQRTKLLDLLPSLKIVENNIEWDESRVCQVIKVLSNENEKSRQKWSQVRGASREDVVIENNVLVNIIFLLGAILSVIPVSCAIHLGLINVHWVWLYLPMVSISIWVSISEGEFLAPGFCAYETFLFQTFFRSALNSAFKGLRMDAPSSWLTLFFVVGICLCGFAAVIINIYAAFLIGNWIWICLLPTIYFLFVKTDIDFKKIVFVARSNNFLKLVESVEKIQEKEPGVNKVLQRVRPWRSRA